MSAPGPSHSNDGQTEEQHLSESMLNLQPPPPAPSHGALTDEHDHQIASSSSPSFYDQIPAAAAEAVAAARAAAANEEHANDHHLLHHTTEHADSSSSSAILDTVTAAAAAAAAAAQSVSELSDPPIGASTSSAVYDTVTAAAAVAAAAAADHATNGSHYLGRIESLEGLTEGMINGANQADDESHHQSAANAGEKKQKQKRRTIRKACDICHVAKVKCILPYTLEQPVADENGEVQTNSGPVHRPQAPCERCQKLRKDCTFTPVVKRKGRKRKIEELYGPGPSPTSAAAVAAAAASATAAASAAVQTGYSDASVQTSLETDGATRAADLDDYQLPLQSRAILPPPPALQPEHTSDDVLAADHDANAAAAAAVAAAAASAADNANEDQVLEWFDDSPTKIARTSISHSPLPAASQASFQPLYLDGQEDEQTS
ncbi:hypothetical protein OC845_005122 [Tilletia horrida]|nr:hypothetical protein OC845_005122 [Tilletia horrida]